MSHCCLWLDSVSQFPLPFIGFGVTFFVACNSIQRHFFRCPLLYCPDSYISASVHSCFFYSYWQPCILSSDSPRLILSSYFPQISCVIVFFWNSRDVFSWSCHQYFGICKMCLWLFFHVSLTDNKSFIIGFIKCNKIFLDIENEVHSTLSITLLLNHAFVTINSIL